MKYREYFGFKEEPFSEDIAAKNLLRLPEMVGVKERMDYVLSLGGVMAVTGDVGAGKSTALRWSISHYHPSQVLVLNLVAGGGAITEFYKQVCWALEVNIIGGGSRSYLLKQIKTTLREIVLAKKQKVLVVVDEASLIRAEAFAEIHTMLQFENDSRNLLAIVFAGQASLLDKLTFRSSAPLASRVMAKTHLQGLDRDQMAEYLLHHLKIAGVKKMLFSDAAVTAIHQGSGGLLRKANFLAKGSLLAAAIEEKDTVAPEHVRIASTELI